MKDGLPDIDPVESQEWQEAIEDVIARDGPDRAHYLLDRAVQQARAAGATLPFSATTPYQNTIPSRRPAGDPRRRGHGMAHPHHQPLERHGDRGAAQQGVERVRRAHRLLRLLGGDVRHRAQPLLALAHGRSWRRPGVLPGPRHPRHLRALLRRGPHQPGAAGELPLRGRRRGAVVLPPPLADARLLAVPDRLDGARALDGDLPGAVHEVPAQPRPDRHGRPQGVVLPRRRRDGRARVAGRHRARGARGSRQPDLRRQLQPPTARRSGARQRQDRAGVGGRVPRRRLGGHQAAVGEGLGRSA